jgi:hypothetical protein
LTKCFNVLSIISVSSRVVFTHPYVVELGDRYYFRCFIETLVLSLLREEQMRSLLTGLNFEFVKEKSKWSLY